MTKEKQIEEMAKIVGDCKSVKDEICYKHLKCADCKASRCYDAGYRKASDVAMEIIADLINSVDELLKVYIEERAKECAIDTPLAEYLSGKIDAYSSVKFRLAELEKKYTEEGK